MKKRLLALLLTLVMCVGISSEAFAASGVPTEANVLSTDGGEIMPLAAETWGKTSTWKEVGGFTMEGNNMTPVKTIGASGKLSIRLTAWALGPKEEIDLRVRIVEAYSEELLKEWWLYDRSLVVEFELPGSLSVKKGDQIQVYFRAYDPNTGNYLGSEEVMITYWYKLT